MPRLVNLIRLTVLLTVVWLFVILNIYEQELSKLASIAFNKEPQLVVESDFNQYNKRPRKGNVKQSSLATISVLVESSTKNKMNPTNHRSFSRTDKGVTSVSVSAFENKRFQRPKPRRISDNPVRRLNQNAPFHTFSPKYFVATSKKRIVSFTVMSNAMGSENRLRRETVKNTNSKSNNVLAKDRHQKDSAKKITAKLTVSKSYSLVFSKQQTIKSLIRTGEVKSQQHKIKTAISMSSKLWFLRGGEIRPMPCAISTKTGTRLARLYPEEDPGQDRIPNQLMFIPPKNTVRNNKHQPIKTIFLNDYSAWGVPVGRTEFIQQKCPVNNCVITQNTSYLHAADLLVWRNNYRPINNHKRPPSQVWLLQMLESPYTTRAMENNNFAINWTATYRSDSTIVSPYERWYYYDKRVTHANLNINYAQHKTKKIAWFVSNCNTMNNRMTYAKELQKYIGVDIYGGCGTKSCPRNIRSCFDMLNKDYKFYLSFENSNCREYITEQFFFNGLQ